MKYTLIIYVALYATFDANITHAQSSYGFRVGANVATLEGGFVENVDSEPLVGLIAGSYVKYDIRNEFGVQIEVVYSAKGLTLPGFQTTDSESTLQAVYLEIPILLAYSIPLSSTLTPTFHVGPALAFEISERTFDRVDGFEQSQSSSLLRSPDIGVAVGMDLNFNFVSLDMLAGVRYTYGFRDLATSDTNDVESARARVLSFTVGFLL